MNEIPVGVIVKVVGKTPFRGAIGYVEAAENPVPVMFIWGWIMPGVVHMVPRENLELTEKPDGPW